MLFFNPLVAKCETIAFNIYFICPIYFFQFVSGTSNESNGTYKINIKSNRLHFATRGLKNSIGDLEYENGKIRVGIRANNIPVNVFVDLI